MLSLPGLTSPGAKSSEFLVTVLNVVAQIVLAWTNTIPSVDAAKYGTFGAIAYALARGLAKYETRGTTPPPPQA